MDNELRPLNKHDYLFHWGGCRHGSGSLALLARHLAGPGPPVLLLGGRPSIGKSRLLYEAMRRAAACGWQVLHGGCSQRGGQKPYAPLQGALQRYLRRRDPIHLRADLQGCAWLVRLLPDGRRDQWCYLPPLQDVLCTEERTPRPCRPRGERASNLTLPFHITAPHAQCSVVVHYASGHTSGSRSLQGLKEANSAGTVAWSWTPATRTPGAATATVSCALGTRQGAAVATFAVQ
jgi:hypothetical protein